MSAADQSAGGSQAGSTVDGENDLELKVVDRTRDAEPVRRVDGLFEGEGSVLLNDLEDDEDEAPTEAFDPLDVGISNDDLGLPPAFGDEAPGAFDALAVPTYGDGSLGHSLQGILPPETEAETTANTHANSATASQTSLQDEQNADLGGAPSVDLAATNLIEEESPTDMVDLPPLDDDDTNNTGLVDIPEGVIADLGEHTPHPLDDSGPSIPPLDEPADDPLVPLLSPQHSESPARAMPVALANPSSPAPADAPRGLPGMEPPRPSRGRPTLPPPLPLEASEADPRVRYAPSQDGDSLDGEVTSVFESTPAPTLPRGRLTVVGGEDAGKIYYLNRPEVSMGRATDNDVVLLDIAVSRRHARIVRHDDGFKVLDQKSGNGIFVNGRRTPDAELYDGDRLEVGNILLDFSTVGGERRRPAQGQGPATDPGRRITGARKPVRSGPPVWLVFAVTFVVITLLTLLVQRSLMSNREAPEDPARAKARAYYARAASAMQSRDWDTARTELSTAEELAPEALNYDEMRGRIESEAQRGRLILEAESLAKRADPESIARLMGTIPEDSAYSVEARKLVERVSAAALDRRVEEARRLAAAGRVAQALVVAEEVLDKRPDHPDAKKVLATLKASIIEGATPAEVAGRKGRSTLADRHTRRDLADGLRLYRQERFGAAVMAMERATARRGSDRLVTRARKGVEHIRLFEREWALAASAERARKVDEAIAALGRALQSDQQLGGFFERRINRRLATLYYLKAIQQFDQGQFAQARRQNDRVLALAPDDENGRKLRDRLEQKATTLLHRAQDLSMQSPEQARTLAREVLSMTDQEDTAYQKAYQLLQQLKR